MRTPRNRKMLKRPTVHNLAATTRPNEVAKSRPESTELAERRATPAWRVFATAVTASQPARLTSSSELPTYTVAGQQPYDAAPEPLRGSFPDPRQRSYPGLTKGLSVPPAQEFGHFTGGCHPSRNSGTHEGQPTSSRWGDDRLSGSFLRTAVTRRHPRRKRTQRISSAVD